MNSQRSPNSGHTTEPRWKSIESAVQALRNAWPVDTQRILGGLLAGYADALRQLVHAQLQRGDLAGSVSSAREALALRPDDPLLLDDLGNALVRAGELDAAVAAFRRAVELSPTSKGFWYDLGNALKLQAHAEEAKTAFETALACDPGYTQARGALGDVLGSIGDSEGAAACYRLCAQDRTHAPRAWSRLATLRTLRMSAEDVVELRRLAKDHALGDNDRILVGYAFAKALEDVGDYQTAFAILSEASTLKRKQVSWDARKFSDWIGRIEAAFAQPVGSAADPEFGREVIFVVGMPRSGTTLVEQILASHPQVEGACELNDLRAVINEESNRRRSEFPQWVRSATSADWQRLGEDYLRRTARWRQERPHFTDKGLDNWPLIGAAQAMLPGARFVNCSRDPLETCLSGYRQLFYFGNHATYDMAEIAAYWRDYDRLSSAWRRLYPDRVIDEVHEELVAAPEEQVRRLLEFLRLPFDPACLEFHRSRRVVGTFSSGQVRQPLQRNTACAHLYGAALDPLRVALGYPRPVD